MNKQEMINAIDDAIGLVQAEYDELQEMTVTELTRQYNKYVGSEL